MKNKYINKMNFIMINKRLFKVKKKIIHQNKIYNKKTINFKKKLMEYKKIALWILWEENINYW